MTLVNDGKKFLADKLVCKFAAQIVDNEQIACINIVQRIIRIVFVFAELICGNLFKKRYGRKIDDRITFLNKSVGYAV